MPRNPVPLIEGSGGAVPRIPPSPIPVRFHTDVLQSRSAGSSDKDDSPKLPPSPVLRTLRHERPSPINISNRRAGKSAKKISGLLCSSSSEEETDEPQNMNRKKSTSTEESTSPSPRTPNSCKILSGIEKNQATAFHFPPSPFLSRPSSLEKEKVTSGERHSSDETRTTVSSIRSQSTSSDVFDDVPAVSVPPAPVVRSQRINLLRKQTAIAEENTVASKQSTFRSSKGESGSSDCLSSTPPLTERSRSRVSNKSDSSPVNPQELLEKALSEEESQDLSTIFRKVTIKKRVAPIGPIRQSTPIPCGCLPDQQLPLRPSSEPLPSSRESLICFSFPFFGCTFPLLSLPVFVMCLIPLHHLFVHL